MRRLGLFFDDGGRSHALKGLYSKGGSKGVFKKRQRSLRGDPKVSASRRNAVHSLTPVNRGSVLCPICRRPLTWAPDRWLGTFECERCGQFSDFGTVAESRRRAPTTLRGFGGPDDLIRKS